MTKPSLWPLFLISGAAVGFEIALTRYFAVAKWSEYGYWVISIVMVGFALSGVAIALVRDWSVRHGTVLLRWLPVALIVTGALGFRLVTTNPFNPLQLQNAATYEAQLWNIAAYYAVLLPFFFLTGLYISLTFVMNDTRIPRVYGYDLTGAGAGAALVLALMAVLHPFYLIPALLVVIAGAAWIGPAPLRTGVAALLALVACEAVLIGDNQAEYNEFKAIYAPSHVPDAKVVAEVRSPRGLYALLDDFTERLDTDVSNNASLLGVPGPPTSYGLYRDGNRIASLPRTADTTATYAPAALDALPYLMRPGARTLLAGSGGGFRVTEVLALGAGAVDTIEPDPVIMGALRHGLGPSPALAPDSRVRLLDGSPLALGARYDVVDISGDFLDAGEANSAAFTAEAMHGYLRALNSGGMVSIPVSIREFPVYAVRVLATVRQALQRLGMADPSAHVVVYRSAWTVRILVTPAPWTTQAIDIVRRFTDERSFDISYYPGIDVAAARAGIFNDLPAVDFTTGEVTSGAGSQDAVADEAGAVLRGEDSASQTAFNLAPITLDRPAYYSVLRLEQLPNILKRLEIMPQPEVAQLVNVAVLVQAAVLAVLVLAVPILVPRVAGARRAGARPAMLRPVVYFASLGLGFLFIEIFLIEKASLYLNDRTSAFAIVLTGMLIFSGLGSLLADRVRQTGIALSSAIVVGWCALALLGLEPVLLATLNLPWAARTFIVLMLVAPVSVALGLPFPLGLARAGVAGGGLLPWAWALNGAFSVVATPLANLVAVQYGFDRVLLLAALLYVVIVIAYPSIRKVPQWQPSLT